MQGTRQIVGLLLAGICTAAGGCYRGVDDSAFAGATADGGGTAGTGGSAGGEDTLGEPGATCDGVDATPIRRLNRREYINTIRTLFGEAAAAKAEAIPSDDASGRFDTDSATLGVTPTLVEGYMLVAEAVAAETSEGLLESLPCPPPAGEWSDAPTPEQDACAQAWLAELAPRVFRRPVTDAELAALAGVFARGRDEEGFDAGLRLALARMLQSPAFLYRVELGTGEEAVTPRPITAYEMASRMSYFLWADMPDAALFEAAAAGELDDVEGVEAHARRMLEDPRAMQVLLDFHAQWLELDAIGSAVKSPEVFPEYSPELGQAMQEQTERFVEHLLVEDDGRLPTLLTATWAPMTADLAPVYGVDAGDFGDEFSIAQLDPSERAGVLTQAGLLAALAAAARTSPVRRGVFVRERLLCDPTPPPPPGVDTAPPEPVDGETAREQFERHRSDPTCAACHDRIDPIGFGFEQYDGLGRFRTQEAGQAIDARGEVVGSDIGTFDGAVNLAEALADDPLVHECVTRQWFRYALGRVESDLDACHIADLSAAFVGADLDIRELVVAIVRSHSFRHRPGGDA